MTSRNRTKARRRCRASWQQRVAVVGSGGAGKTTFAIELGRRTGLPVIHLDRLHWKPGWIETPADKWRGTQAELVTGARWIVDGNYGGTFDVLRRALRNRGVSVQADGCPERLNLTFLRWVWRYPTDSRPRLDAAIERYRLSTRLVELTAPSQVREFLDSVDGASI